MAPSGTGFGGIVITATEGCAVTSMLPPPAITPPIVTAPVTVVTRFAVPPLATLMHKNEL
jgi:hypothetical protein